MTNKIVAVSALVGSAMVLSHASPAGADTQYPASCSIPLDGDWSNGCYVGSGYATNSHYVLHVQTVAKYFDADYSECVPSHCFHYITNLTRDGVFGQSTKQGVQTFQSNICYDQYAGDPNVCSGVNDGIVGPRTWTWMNQAVVADYGFTIKTSNYKYYQGENPSTSDPYVLRLDISGANAGHWQVTTTTGTWVYTDMHG